MTERRDFLRTAALGSLFALGTRPSPALIRGRSPFAAPLPDAGTAAKPLKLLILGGTGLMGPHQVRYALARGHQVTVFNRGRRNEILPAGVEELKGDRNLHEVDALKGRDWDVVVDNPVSLPFWVRDVGAVLKGHVGQYIFISSISAYDTKGQASIQETSPLAEYKGADPLAVTEAEFMKDLEGLFGPLKVASEREAARWFGAQTTIIRPGLIVGPGDSSFRFTYWPWRIDQGGEILAPGDGADPVQVIDTRDLAEWTVRMAENGTTGTFNACGPRSPMTMAEQLAGIRGALNGDGDLRFTWVDAEFLAAQKVAPWGEMTTWIPRSEQDSVIARSSNQKAIAAGLRFRPLAQTAVDALAWVRDLPEAVRNRVTRAAGLAPEKERAVLAAWHQRKR